MSLLENLLAPGTIERLGWMLVHILWQATVVAILLAIFLRLLRKSSANVRYCIACSALAMMVAMPIVTMQLMKTPGPAAEAGPPSVVVTLSPEATAPAVQALVETTGEVPAVAQLPDPLPTANVTVHVPLQERIVSTLEPALPYVVLGWLVGVFGLSAWHLGGWVQLQRLRRRMVSDIGRPLQQRLEELSIRLGVPRAVGLLESALIEVPTVVGWLRPVILLPASALTGLRREQLEAILAHELAHVRRYDYLVNIVQTVVEILGFYHPAVWWVSHRIRIERENCCDDLAVHVCGSSLQYAKALACMEEIRHSGRELAMAATGGSLMARIARLLGRPTVDDRRFAWLPGLVALLLVAGLIIPAALVLGTPPVPQATVATAPNATEPSTASANAESANGSANSANGEPAKVLLDFKVLQVLDDLRLDRETTILVAKALGSQSQLAREFLRPDRKIDPTLGEILKRYVVPEPLSERAVDTIVSLLGSRGYLVVLSAPRVEVYDGQQATMRAGNEHFLAGSDPSAKIERIEYGTAISATPHVLDANRVALEMRADVGDLAPSTDPNQPTVLRTSAETNATVWNGQYLVWAAVTPTAAPAGAKADRRSVYIMVKPQINLPPQGLAGTPDERRPDGTPPRQVLLDVRTVTMDSGALESLGVPWSRPTGGPSASVRTGYAADEAFTGALLTALDRLQADHQATVSSQQIIVQEGHPSQIKALRDQWSAGAQPHKTETGTVVKVRPHVANDNTILLELVIDTTRPLPTPPGSDLPMQSAQTCQSTVAIKDGGTAAIGGLSMPGAQGRPGQETVIFVTTHLVQDGNEASMPAQPKADPAARLPLSSEQIARMRQDYVNSDPMVRELVESIVETLRSLITARQTLTESHPDVVRTKAMLEAQRKRLAEKLDQLGQEFDNQLPKRLGEQTGNRAEGRQQATITATFTNADLVVILAEIARQTGVKITTDATVKPILVTAELTEASSETALRQVLKNTPYVLRKTEDNGCLVFRPLSFIFPQVELAQVIQDLSVATGVPIVAAPNVSGTVTATFENCSLDEALELVLAGKPYVLRKMPRYYLVTDRAAASPPPRPSARPVVRAFSPVTTAFAQTDLRDALAEISKCTGAQITPDATVKPTPITAKLADASVDTALQQVLKDTGYSFRKADDGTYLVFRPLSNCFFSIDLCQVLQDLSAAAGVPIVAAPNVSGTVRVAFENWPLEEVLELVLAGKPYVFKRMPRYYLVTDPAAASPPPRPSARPVVRAFSPVTAAFAQTDLRDALAEISKCTGAQITPDATVKPTPVTAKLAGVSVDTALQQVLQNTGYTFRKADDGTYLVFRPLSNSFPGIDLNLVLQDLSAAAGVPIVVAPNVSGTVTVTFENCSLDEALELVLAGKPYVFKKTPHYYLVTDRSAASNANVPQNVTRPPQVLMEARAVAIEPSDLQNLGLEWDWPVSRTARFPDAVPETKAPIGYLPDRLSTDSLMTALNSLCENGRARTIANPKMEVPQEGWFPVIVPSNGHSYTQPELQNVESRTVLTMTPHIGDHNNITLRMTAAVSDSTPATRAGGLPPTRRRTVNESITVQDGDTFAVAGLAEDRAEQTDKPSRKVVVFVTARLVPDTSGAPLPTPPSTKTAAPAASQVVAERAAADATVTRRIRLNYVRPDQVTQRLSPVFAPYVQAEQPNPGDPNGQGNVLLITAAPAMADRIEADIKRIDHAKRQVLLDARVVALEKGNLLNLGVEWSWPTTQAGTFTSSGLVGSTGTTTGGQPYGIQIGCTPDQTFTNSLMMALNLLQENKQAEIIANPKVVAQDGRQAEMKVIEDEWFAMTGPATKDGSDTRPELQKVESGTVLTITPDIGDNNDITLQMVVEVSDIIPKARGGSDLPKVTRRVAKNSVTVKDGGTVAVGGLADNRGKMDEQRVPVLSSIPLVGGLFRSRSNDKSSREVALFVTAHLLPDTGAETSQASESGATTVRIPPPTGESGPGREGPDGSGASTPAEDQEQVAPRVQIGTRFLGADERLLQDLRGSGAIRGVTSPQETETLHEIGRRLSEGKSLVLTDEQTGLLMKTAPQYPDCRMLSMPKGVVRENELLPIGIGEKIPYTAGYEEPNEPAGKPKPRQATVDSGLTFETTAHVVNQDEVRLDCVLRMTTLLGFDEKKYQGRYRYQVPKTENVVSSLDNPIVPSGGTSLTLGPQARLKTADRAQTILILVTPSIVEGKTSPKAADTAARPPDSRAWSIMRQQNCPPLLLGLTQQLLKVLEPARQNDRMQQLLKTLQPSRQNDAMWRETASGGSLQLNVRIEQIESREIAVGLFADAKWSQEPVAVRLLPGAGTHTLTGLPAGRYQIGAMMGRAPSPAALGVQRTWPEAIEIKPGQTTHAELLVSRAFALNASGRHNRETSRDYTGDWSLLNENHLLQGRLTGPDGVPIAFGRVSVREYHAVPTGSIAAPELGTNENGFYKFDGMKWPYRVSATWSDTLPDLLGYRYQYKGLNRVLEGPQKVDFQFDRFPAGTAGIAGRVVDEHGAAVTAFYLRVRTLESSATARAAGSLDREGEISTAYGYVVPFLSADGSFTLSGLPAGRVAVNAAAFDYRPYKHDKDREVILEAGKTAEVRFEMIHNKLFHGRVLFEDGSPAVVTPAPWEGAKTVIRLDQTLPFRLDQTVPIGQGDGHAIGDVAEVDAKGCFAVYFLDWELEGLRSGTAQLRISLPDKHKDLWQSGGKFPFEKLAEDRARAGTVTVRRPESVTAPATPASSARPKAKSAWMVPTPTQEPPIGTPEKDMVIFELKERIAEVEQGIDFLQQTLGPTHPVIAHKQALLASLRQVLERKPTRFDFDRTFWDGIRRRPQIAFEGHLASIRADATLDADTATQVLALVAQADETTRASLTQEELRTAPIQQILQRLGSHLPGESFQALLRLLESKKLVHLIEGIGVCIPEDRLWTTSGPVLAEPPSHPLALNVFGETLEPEHMVLLDIEATVKLTEPVPLPAGRISDQTNVPVSTRTLEWTGRSTIPDDRHAVLLLNDDKPGANRSSEVPCLIIRSRIVETRPPAAPEGRV